MGAVNVAGTQATPFQIAELVEQEKRMVAGAAEVTVVGRALLFAVGRADA
jgi:heme A synthase